MEVKPPTMVDPEYDGLKRISEEVTKSIKLIEDLELNKARESLYYVKGIVTGLGDYFELKIKEDK